MKQESNVKHRFLGGKRAAKPLSLWLKPQNRTPLYARNRLPSGSPALKMVEYCSKTNFMTERQSGGRQKHRKKNTEPFWEIVLKQMANLSTCLLSFKVQVSAQALPR